MRIHTFIGFPLFGLTLVGCASPTTKPWHLATRDTEYAVRYTPERGAWRERLSPPRGPEVSYSALRGIHVGDRGERIYELTKPQYPHYIENGALVETRVNGKSYEVGFLYRPDHSGIIADISYLPVPDTTSR